MSEAAATERTALPDRVRELLDEATAADGTPPVSDQALLGVAQGRRELMEFAPGAAPAAEDAALGAVGIVGEGELDLVVRPAERGRGVGRRALHALLARNASGSSTELRAWAHGENPAAEALLRGAGFEPVRELLRMTLEPALLPGAIAEARPLPDGFRVVPFDPAEPRHAQEWVRVNAAAFASHPEQGAMRLGDFEALTREPWFRAEDLRLAFEGDGDEAATGPAALLAGFTWIKSTSERGRVETELYVLGVDPVHAGRGLGAALLGETLRRMAAHDPRRISLYVDGDNLGARALYERAGFEVEQRSSQWLRRGA